MDSHTSYLFLLSTYLFKSCPYARSMLSLSLSLSPYLSFVLFRCLNHSFPSIDHLFYPFYPMAVAFIYLQHTIHSLTPHPLEQDCWLSVCLSVFLSVRTLAVIIVRPVIGTNRDNIHSYLLLYSLSSSSSIGFSSFFSLS